MEKGTIFRTIKNRDNPFVQIHKELFENERMSWAAKGLMGYLLTKTDKWEVRIGDLLKHSTNKITALRKIIKELEQFGYMRRVKTRDSAGQFRWITEVYEEPIDVSISEASTKSKPAAKVAGVSQATSATIN
jgi:hypothetical protein